MTVEWTISAGNIISLIFTMIGAAAVILTFIYRWGIDINTIIARIGAIEKAMTVREDDLKEINKVLLVVVRNDERLNAVDVRVNQMQQIRDEWRLDVAKRLSDISQALADIYRQQGLMLHNQQPPFVHP